MASPTGGRLLLDNAWLAGFRPVLLLTLLCAALFLPGLASIPPTDRDESRFMQASKQMIESGDWVHIRFQDESRNKKPIGIYWLQATTVQVIGRALTATWPYRLPSAVAAWLAVLTIYRCGQRLFNPAAGLIAGAVLATSFIVVVEAHIAKTDAALLAATTLTLTMLAELYVARDEKPSLIAALLFWLGLGIGILIKGPIVVLVAGATIVALCIADRNLRWFKALRVGYGIPLTLVIVLPWLIAISISTQGDFVADSLRQDLLPKLIGGQEGHGAPPGTYIAAAILTAWPWSVLAPFVLVAAWRRRAHPAVRFCLAWLIPAWIIFEIVPTKLPHYTMPLYPAFALLTAWVLTETDAVRDFCVWVGRALGIFYRIVWACVTVTLAVGIVYASKVYGDGLTAGVLGATAAIALAAGFVLIGLAHASALSSAAGLTAAGMLLSISLTSGVLPHLRQLAISPRIAAAVSVHESEGPIALAGFHEPSAVFLLGTSTLLTDTAGAAAHILAAPGAIAVVPTDALESISTTLTAAGRSVRQLEEVDGYNYSRGRWEHLAVVTAGEQQP
jgi:4-amino-4-deoxy-L-arabinose transferase-like glycosyltransferase